ncbi:Pre-mRNA-splicing factor SYF1 [Trichinella pseudospiralis]|uniref:Pre-mRNA-splicing factor SYF1 n=2 Tax=Trichinella pseudospiralis TaxID=6337 RepID=A0A0V0XXH0_TRIPS|nr:Pre-mRNA-splicing factor SYF1 [Trichinella pseudospiralis]
MSSTADLLIEEDDIPYEEDLFRNRYSLKCWLRYIEHKTQSSKNIASVNLLYQRALRELPGSYKLWYQYLKLRRGQAAKKCVTDPLYEEVNKCFRRALVFMNKMPRIWILYCTFLVKQRFITRTRHAFDDALRSLPITQHYRIWPIYLKFLHLHDIPETTIRVYERYLKIAPQDAELLVEYLKSVDRLDLACIHLSNIVNDSNFISREGKTNHELWHELCSIVAKNPSKVTSLNAELLVREGVEKYPDQAGALWCSLADYYIRDGCFEQARDVYEEAMRTVRTVRDFTQIFDACAHFMEELINAELEAQHKSDSNFNIDLLMARFENLMDRRPLLINSVLLRQNPHNVYEWLKRAELCKNNPEEVERTFEKAVKTVNAKLQLGKLSSLWIAYAVFFEQQGQLKKAREVFERALLAPYPKVDDLASVYCSWAEMELRSKKWQKALQVIKRAVKKPALKTDYYDESETVQNRVYKSLKVWSMYADLEESFGTFESCKEVYEKILDLRIATPQLIINYTMLLESKNHFEESFKVFEKGIALFRWPNVNDLWETYLVRFLKRYAGSKLERARDLFEQCLHNCPPEYATKFYLLYAKLEEEHGLPRNAMNIYQRAIDSVPRDEMINIFNVYIKKATELFGVTSTRAIYEKAIEVLPEKDARSMCLQFATLERRLGEIDRARAILAHCSQMCDPRVVPAFWSFWKDFEIKHGNEDTVREMLRIKRSVQAALNTQVNFMSSQMLATAGGPSEIDELGQGDSMALLEAKAQKISQEASKKDILKSKMSSISFVSSGVNDEKSGQNLSVVNEDEINIEDDDDELSVEVESKFSRKSLPDVVLEKQIVPSEVFGSLAVEEEQEQ